MAAACRLLAIEVPNALGKFVQGLRRDMAGLHDAVHRQHEHRLALETRQAELVVAPLPVQRPERGHECDLRHHGATQHLRERRVVHILAQLLDNTGLVVADGAEPYPETAHTVDVPFGQGCPGVGLGAHPLVHLADGLLRVLGGLRPDVRDEDARGAIARPELCVGRVHNRGLGLHDEAVGVVHVPDLACRPLVHDGASAIDVDVLAHLPYLRVVDNSA
mmetsp:Transcript_15589/g.43091  ORF Transcript_15589/g.43091 Transcript_15589/m.43091 type:complete len:219 (-) Transcript_15589:100-756(-)